VNPMGVGVQVCTGEITVPCKFTFTFNGEILTALHWLFSVNQTVFFPLAGYMTNMDGIA